jgi:hypothetical protein
MAALERLEDAQQQKADPQQSCAHQQHQTQDEPGHLSAGLVRGLSNAEGVDKGGGQKFQKLHA